MNLNIIKNEKTLKPRKEIIVNFLKEILKIGGSLKQAKIKGTEDLTNFILLLKLILERNFRVHRITYKDLFNIIQNKMMETNRIKDKQLRNFTAGILSRILKMARDAYNKDSPEISEIN